MKTAKSLQGQGRRHFSASVPVGTGAKSNENSKIPVGTGAKPNENSKIPAGTGAKPNVSLTQDGWRHPSRTPVAHPHFPRGGNCRVFIRLCRNPVLSCIFVY
jgi:hypothetical protein